ncbi:MULTISPECIES: amino acid permease [Natrialbaceae]|uniref:amino acid permease n=1 Tax=Natrialbaceae TaxID=1644061 RepID=UPI00207CF6FB|nr:amino acid permease [Natronococcus sp. CG52]
MAAEDFKLINEEIGPVAAVALLIGTAVGMSGFIVPTQMAAIAGPSVTVAILISVLPMVLGVLLLLQLGGAIPVSGGIYVYDSGLGDFTRER